MSSMRLIAWRGGPHPERAAPEVEYEVRVPWDTDDPRSDTATRIIRNMSRVEQTGTI